MKKKLIDAIIDGVGFAIGVIIVCLFIMLWDFITK